MNQPHHLLTLRQRIHGFEQGELGHGAISTHEIELCLQIIALIFKTGSYEPLN